MMECFGRKAECRAPCEVSARCIQESGRLFSAGLVPGPGTAVSQELAATS
ncbi:MAG: hypothetical protein GXO65_05910 [Euryarchaeota archaeon]|nr:hypothetical protein [Euryarchaeota archaeon]